MIIWFKDDVIKIEFTQVPVTETLNVLPHFTKEQIENIDKKPYILKNEITIKITYERKVSYFTIPYCYRWNNADIPCLWYIIGNPDNPRFRIPSCVHDYLCEHKEAARNDRYLSTLIFERLLKVAGVGKVKRFLMFHFVDNFQKIMKW